MNRRFCGDPPLDGGGSLEDQQHNSGNKKTEQRVKQNKALVILIPMN
jgi:hypothetical protein